MNTANAILVVDDSPDMRRCMKALLEVEGYTVACAANGREALDYLRRAERPLAIVLDLNMPVMSGWEFRECQRRDPELAGIPIFLISAEEGLDGVAARLGAAGHSPKPVEVNWLLNSICRLGKSKSGRVAC